jgi:hypothetical protein
VKRVGELPLQGDPDILAHAQMRKDRRNLERPHHAAAGYVGGLEGGDVAAVVENLSGRGVEKLCQEVEDGRLAGAVRPDQRVDRAAADREIHPLHRGEAAELFGQTAGFEDYIVQA